MTNKKESNARKKIFSDILSLTCNVEIPVENIFYAEEAISKEKILNRIFNIK